MARKAKPGEVVEIPTKVRGVSYRDPDSRQSRQWVIKKFVRKGMELEARREASEDHPNAIGLWVKKLGLLGVKQYRVGWVSSDLAERCAPVMDAGTELQVMVLKVTGGKDGKSLGVNVMLRYVEPPA